MSASDLQPGNSDATPSHPLDDHARVATTTTFLVERYILTPDGHVWHVGERAVDAATDRPMLFFVADHAMRRVRNYPPNWRELSDDDLYAVSLLP